MIAGVWAQIVQARASPIHPGERQRLDRDPLDLPGGVAASELQPGTSGISRPFPRRLARKAGATLGYCVRECVEPTAEPFLRTCALSIVLSMLAFFGLFTAAALIYPGGNWLDRAAHGHRFFANYVCDLTQPVSLSGVNNPLGSRLAQLAMLCFAAALSGFFWLVPRYFATDSRVVVWVRGLGECAVLSYLTVPFTPSQRFGDIHAWLSLLSGGLGLCAALCAVGALLRSNREARLLGIVGALALAVGTLHAALFVRYLHGSQPAPLIVPAAQKVAALLLSGWMLGAAWPTLSRRREIDR